MQVTISWLNSSLFLQFYLSLLSGESSDQTTLQKYIVAREHDYEFLFPRAF